MLACARGCTSDIFAAAASLSGPFAFDRFRSTTDTRSTTLDWETLYSSIPLPGAPPSFSLRSLDAGTVKEQITKA